MDTVEVTAVDGTGGAGMVAIGMATRDIIPRPSTTHLRSFMRGHRHIMLRLRLPITLRRAIDEKERARDYHRIRHRHPDVV